MPENKDHWYDGRFYDLFIAPNQDKLFRRVQDIINPESTVLDVGCGTGRLALQLANKCKSIDAVDLSKRNIDIARRNFARQSATNVVFHHSDVLHLLGDTAKRYDYAVLTYVIHEMDESVRQTVLEALSRVAHKIIIVDYLAPQPRAFVSMVNELIEYVAGRDHYRNFKSFLGAHGLTGLAKSSGLSIVSEERIHPSASHVLVVAGTLVSPSDLCW
jgi:2-polyprenyl-3-methyl-5-hydroxy-6-metoxy-1,4-benzoquinol methylase